MIHFAEDSYVNHIGQPVDCRYLSMAMEFCELTTKEAISLAMNTATWIDELLKQDFHSVWRLNRRGIKIRDLPATFLANLESMDSFSLLMEAFVRNSYIHGAGSFRKMRSSMQKMIGELYSSDTFIKYWNTHFSEIKNNRPELRRQIVQLFHEKNMMLIAKNGNLDSQALIRVSRHSHNRELFYGTIQFHIGVMCIANNTNLIANMLVEYMKQVSQVYHNLNGRVMLQPFSLSPGGSPYMDYFGENCNCDGSHIEKHTTPQEWYYTYYLCGIEWANIISPITLSHIPKLRNTTANDARIIISQLEGGSILIMSAKEICSYDIDDALLLKSHVEDALYPGMKEYPIGSMYEKNDGEYYWDSLPRHDWAIVPVYNDEVEIIGSSLVFRSINYF